MDTQPSDAEEIEQNNLLVSAAQPQLEPRELELLILIANSESPLGARELGRRLGATGRVSESTVNRLLRRLDEQGLTKSLAGRGRVASAAGRLVADRAVKELKWNEELGSLDIRTLDDVRDLIAARRGIEREIVRSVALHATSEDIDVLRATLEDYSRSINTERRRHVTVDFHKALASICPNRMLKAAAMVVFDTRFDVFEQILDIITDDLGRTQEGPHEHDAVMDAIINRDPDAAEAAMVGHLDRLTEDVSADASKITLITIELFLQDKQKARNSALF